MFSRSKSRRRRHQGSSDEPPVYTDPSGSGRSRRSIPKRLLIPVWLLVISNFVFLIVGSFYLSGQGSPVAEPADTLKRPAEQSLYQKAIADAAYTGPEKLSYMLQPLERMNALQFWQNRDGEPWVKVLRWMTEAQYQEHFAVLDPEQTYQLEDALPTDFVTVVPQVKDFCSRLPNDDDFQVDYRLKQYLGLHPGLRLAWMVEFWVPETDLFRPCPDPEVSDRYCQLKVDSRQTPRVRNIADYPAFLRQLGLASYRSDGRPWTRLGYTYDWANGAHGVGASEYMIIPKGRYRLAGSYNTDEYCGRKEP